MNPVPLSPMHNQLALSTFLTHNSGATAADFYQVAP